MISCLCFLRITQRMRAVFQLPSKQVILVCGMPDSHIACALR